MSPVTACHDEVSLLFTAHLRNFVRNPSERTSFLCPEALGPKGSSDVCRRLQHPLGPPATSPPAALGNMELSDWVRRMNQEARGIEGARQAIGIGQAAIGAVPWNPTQ